MTSIIYILVALLWIFLGLVVLRVFAARGYETDSQDIIMAFVFAPVAVLIILGGIVYRKLTAIG